MNHYIAAMLGTLTGLILSCLPIYFIGLLVGLFFKSKEPEERAMYAALGAWIGIYVIAGFGYADGGAFYFPAGLLYIPATIIAFFMLKRHYIRTWQPHDDELERTFE
jgi:hypothetical protein